MKLTANQIEVLRELEGCEQRKYGGRNRTLPDGSKRRMFAPLEFGGTNGSHHSATATALAKKGLVDRLKYTFTGRPQLNYFKSRSKGACAYALTDEGKRVLAELAKEPSNG